MGIATTIDAIDRDIEFMLAADLGPEAQSRALAAFARENLAEAQETNAKAGGGQVPPHETFVDGRKGAAIESVRPDGTVMFEFDIVSDTIEWIGAQLVKASPVLTGRYARSHAIEVDGEEIDPGQPAPAGRQYYAFINRQPYAAKIEPKLQTTSRRATRGDKRKFEKTSRVGAGQSDQAPDGVYHAVAVVAKARFGNIAKITFGWRYDATTRVSHPAIFVKAF